MMSAVDHGAIASSMCVCPCPCQVPPHAPQFKCPAPVAKAEVTCRYYGYRLCDAFDEDPRLQALDAEWFAGQKVLDIGCNEGVLTLSRACKFGCKRTIGIDIEASLVAKAARSLASLRSRLTQQLAEPMQGCAGDPRCRFHTSLLSLTTSLG